MKPMEKPELYTEGRAHTNRLHRMHATDDTSVCVDDECPWPEHTGECPTFATDAERAQAWKTEAQRCRQQVGLLRGRLHVEREHFREVFGAPRKTDG